ncbi:inner membrane protein YiaA [Aliivibrio fischeri]|uniref:inner membrane protein YiaA n=1 Tax=Aliivibrio fischeri TaxID=668 RepID=UPI0012DAC5B4|nr:inner membrane protein YiaA [Aliivibrio fischeri]MUK67723.1 hypothetical protein [Aliivibrio fischeri]
MEQHHQYHQPTSAFIMASWGAFVIGSSAYLFGLWKSTMELNEKGYYFSLLLLGLFAAISLQKTIRDKQEGINVTSMYTMSCRVALISALLLMAIGLRNAELLLSEKGFFAMAYTLSLFSVVTIQKNIRDVAASISDEGLSEVKDELVE